MVLSVYAIFNSVLKTRIYIIYIIISDRRICTPFNLTAPPHFAQRDTLYTMLFVRVPPEGPAVVVGVEDF